MPAVDYIDCFPTGPDTIAGKYIGTKLTAILHAGPLAEYAQAF